MIDRQQIKQALAALEAQQPVFEAAIFETTRLALENQLKFLEQQEARETELHGERRRVTVMFADISGFTAMSEKLDPEEVRSMINLCFERLGQVVDRYDGHIDKFIGDEIMALFGAPVAHENDPERALRAALEMMATLDAFNREHAALLPKPLALHFGINSGLVIAGGIGTSK
ncbi:MAG: adenylate/guanylate cyclase domain-containing protein, partial [Anaerolineae bacterium]|nr:adenylate/guanylate cyclase domain-containing protein [Anaerolineae bacterium]